MDLSRWMREKSIIAPSVKKYRVYKVVTDTHTVQFKKILAQPKKRIST